MKSKLNLQTFNYETDQNIIDCSISQIKQKLEILNAKEIKFKNKNDFSKDPYSKLLFDKNKGPFLLKIYS